MSKQLIAGIVLAALVAAGLAYYMFWAKPRGEEVPDTKGNVTIPDVNPVNKTNPFSDVKTNPFE